jgi:hypothetical protein
MWLIGAGQKKTDQLKFIKEVVAFKVITIQLLFSPLSFLVCRAADILVLNKLSG